MNDNNNNNFHFVEHLTNFFLWHRLEVLSVMIAAVFLFICLPFFKLLNYLKMDFQFWKIEIVGKFCITQVIVKGSTINYLFSSSFNTFFFFYYVTEYMNVPYKYFELLLGGIPMLQELLNKTLQGKETRDIFERFPKKFLMKCREREKGSSINDVKHII